MGLTVQGVKEPDGAVGWQSRVDYRGYEVVTNDYVTGETFTVDGGVTMRIA